MKEGVVLLRGVDTPMTLCIMPMKKEPQQKVHYSANKAEGTCGLWIELDKSVQVTEIAYVDFFLILG